MEQGLTGWIDRPKSPEALFVKVERLEPHLEYSVTRRDMHRVSTQLCTFMHRVS